MRSQNFVITGMTCANCVNTVSKALNNSNKIQEATVNLATEKAKVIFVGDPYQSIYGFRGAKDILQ
ncbi:MAG: cation transporter, partial [Lactococcus sp.]